MAPWFFLVLLLLSSSCSDPPACSAGRLTVAGTLETFSGPVAFDRAEVVLRHLRDGAAVGLVERVEVELRAGADCVLILVAEGCDPAGLLPVTQATLVTGEGCGMIPFGTYLKKTSESLGEVELSGVPVPHADRAEVCFSEELTIRLEGDLYPTGADPMQILTSNLTLSGDMVSTGIAAEAAACGGSGEDVIIGGDVRRGGDATGDPDVAVIPGQAAVALTLQCPGCTTDATVRVNGTPGDAAGMPDYVFIFHEPEFPVEETFTEARDPAGVPIPWPLGEVTFQAYQDTVPGGSVAEPGEPLSPPVTVTLAPDQVTAVTLAIDATGQTTVSCQPDQWFCVNLETAALCNEEGDYYEAMVCLFGNKCSEVSGKCAPMVCAPGSVECSTPIAWHKCLPSGTGWSVETPCGDGKVCANGNCMNEDCLSQVVFLVDTSQSMGLHWEALAASIDALTVSNPMAYFGLAVFPEFGSICEVPPGFEVPFAGGAGPAVAAWFTDHQPFGQTPLLDALNHMAQVLPDTLAGGGALVVLSDGADTCAYNQMSMEEREALIVQELGETTAGLFQDHGIKTVVVGYQYLGNPDQLNAIAQSGGTGAEAYTAAGNEQELTMALVTIVDNLKECFE